MNPLIALAISVFSAVVCNGLAKTKRKNPSLWTLMGFIFGPIPIAILFFSHPIEAQSNESFVDRVKYYYDLGLLSDEKKSSLEAITSSIRQKYIEDWGETFETDRPLDDKYIIDYGSNKKWWKDTEAGVLKGNNVYINTIKEWSTISEGVFLPKNIVENWKTDEGPIEISFELDNKKYTIIPQYLNDYIDMEIIGKINKLLPSSEKKFEIVAPFDQTAFVLWLGKREKKALKQRGWRFSW